MLVDNHPQPTPNIGIDDFFNFDMFAGNSQQGSSSSSSPSNSYSGLPRTPPDESLFSPADVPNFPMSFALEDALSKVDPFTPTMGGDYDILSSIFASAAAAAQMSSPDSASGSGSSGSALGDSPITIDPQLVGTPAGSNAMSDAGDDELELEHELEEEEEGEGEGDEEDQALRPIKVGGRGNAGRKGTVMSGGVVKRTGGSDKKENKTAGMLSTTSVEPDDWRPSPEEYKKMTSKEKRQLRNKISARNFRVRRKEYISTLEGEIAERNRLLDLIRGELADSKNENYALRQEVQALKKALLEGAGRADAPILPPPAPLPVIPASVLTSGPASNPSSAPQRVNSPLLTPNTKKDLPTSPRAGANGFWGGASSGLGGFGGGITPVHTTLVPEWSSVLSGKAIIPGSKTGRRSPALQENINPVLNNATATSLAGMMGVSQDKQQQQLTCLDSFMDTNPFTLKTLDPYRMQLWRTMAQQQHLARQQGLTQHPPSSPSPTASGLAANLRPHFFTSKQTSLSALLAGKSAISSYPTLPNSPPLTPTASPSSSRTISAKDMPTPKETMLASLASQTLVRKLGSAFWDAFAAPAPTLGRAAGSVRREFDAEKVRKVIEGSAVVRIVDIDPPSPTPAQREVTEPRCSCSSLTEALEEKMKCLSLKK